MKTRRQVGIILLLQSYCYTEIYFRI